MRDLLRCLKAAAEAFATEAGQVIGEDAGDSGSSPPPLLPPSEVKCPFCGADVEKSPGRNSWYRCRKGHSFDRTAPPVPASEV